MIDIKSEHDLGVFSTVELEPQDPFIQQFQNHCNYGITFNNTELYGIGRAYQITFDPKDEKNITRITEILATLPSAKAPVKVGDLNFGPLAFIGVPFDQQIPATAVIPHHILIKNDEKILYGYFKNPVTFETKLEKPSPEFYSVYPVAPLSHYVESVKLALKDIASQEVEKVVLSRSVVIESSSVFNKPLIYKKIQKLSGSYPFLFENFLGLSPELLVSKSGKNIKSSPVANTLIKNKSSSDPLKELLNSEDKRKEHAIVVNHIADKLERITDTLVKPDAPALLETSNLYHLVTPITGELKEECESLSATSIACLLSPTPAVAGEPTEKALNLIRKYEQFDRELYSGTVGIQDALGDGVFVVGLRCANIIGKKAILYAGAGIVQQSDPEAELIETKEKLRLMLNILIDV